MSRGLILFAHGARDARWAEPFEAIAARARALLPDWDVQLAFLELMTPTLADAGGAMVAAGRTQVDIVPLFLGTGGHVRQDLPALLKALRVAHPGVQWRLHRPIGEQADVIAAIALAATNLVRDNESAP